jgi:hypothetical protein
MGHDDGSVQARYSHVAGASVAGGWDGLTAAWTEALDPPEAVAALAGPGWFPH